MRISFLSPIPSLSGGIRAIAAHADGLAKRGHDVSIIATGPRAIPLGRRVKSLLAGRGWPRPVVHRSHYDRLTAPKVVRLGHAGPIVASDVPDGDAIIASWWETAEWATAMPASKGRPLYFVQHHETIFTNQPADRVAATYRLPIPKVCVARWIADTMASEYGDASAEVIPCGIDHATFAAPPRGKQSRPTVGFMFSITPFKAIEVAIAAVERARARVPDLRVVAFGDCVPPAHLRLPSFVEFELAPSQARIVELYSSVDAWLFSSRSEGFGLPILEAMACRTPVIGTPAGVAQEVLPPGGGRVVPMGDADAMARAIVDYVGLDDSSWRSLSDAAFATAGRFRWDEATAAFEASLCRVARGVPLA